MVEVMEWRVLGEGGDFEGSPPKWKKGELFLPWEGEGGTRGESTIREGLEGGGGALSSSHCLGMTACISPLQLLILPFLHLPHCKGWITSQTMDPLGYVPPNILSSSETGRISRFPQHRRVGEVFTFDLKTFGSEVGIAF
jgi:hypothetical protein